MRKIAVFICFVLATVGCTTVDYAQTGWTWAIASDTSASQLESGMGAIDRSGNVFTSYILEGFSATIGTATLIDTTGLNMLAVSKASASGAFLWTVGTQYASTVSWDIACDASGDLYVCGVYVNDSIGIGSVTLQNPGHPYMFFLAKISPTGTVLWAQNVCRTANFYMEWSNGLGLQVDGAGNVYVTGVFAKPTVTIGTTTLTNAGPGGTSDLFIAKYNASGGFVWAKNYGGVNNDYPGVMTVTQKGNIYYYGTYDSATAIGSTEKKKKKKKKKKKNPGPGGAPDYLAKFDSSGSLLWVESLNQNMSIACMAADTAEQLYVSGYITNYVVLGPDTLVVPGMYAFFVAGYNAYGTPKWGRTAAGTSQGYGISLDPCGRIWLCGSITDSMNFGSTTLMLPPGSDPMYIVAYDTAGNYLTNTSIASGGDDYDDILTDNNGNLYIVGDFDMDSFAVGHDTLYAPSFALYGEHLFIAKYNYDTIGCGPCRAGAPVPNFTNSGADTVSFTYTGTTLYDSLRWTFGDGKTDTTTNPVHSYTVSGTYTACVDVYSACVNEGTFVQYCDTIHVYISVDSLTRVGNISNSSIVSIYPNPAKNEFTVHSNIPFAPGARMEIYDITGNVINTYALTGTNVVITAGGLVSGLYQCRLISPGDNTVVKKLVIIK